MIIQNVRLAKDVMEAIRLVKIHQILIGEREHMDVPHQTLVVIPVPATIVVMREDIYILMVVLVVLAKEVMLVGI